MRRVLSGYGKNVSFLRRKSLLIRCITCGFLLKLRHFCSYHAPNPNCQQTLEALSRSKDVFDALVSFGNDLPSVNIDQTMQDAFELLNGNKTPFLTVKDQGDIVDYLTYQEIIRIRLRSK